MQVHRVYLDIETTGLDSERHGIIEVGAVAVDSNGVEVGSYQSLCNPGDEALRNASPEALEVNGIDPDAVRKAPLTEQVSREVYAWLDLYATLHAFPVAFERAFLRVKPWFFPDTRWDECVQEAAQDAMATAGAPKWPRLAEAARFFNIEIVRAHRALDDARTTAKIHAEILADRASGSATEEAAKIMGEGL